MKNFLLSILLLTILSVNFPRYVSAQTINYPLPYLGKFTTLHAAGINFCTVVVTNEFTVITMAHCIRTKDPLSRIVLQTGQEIYNRDFLSITTHKINDIAVIKTKVKMPLPQYAVISTEKLKLGTIVDYYGFCSFFTGVKRQFYFKRWSIYGIWGVPLIYYEILPLANRNTKGCEGDSGGVIIKDDIIYGFISAIREDYFLGRIGSTAYIVPSFLLFPDYF